MFAAFAHLVWSGLVPGPFTGMPLSVVGDLAFFLLSPSGPGNCPCFPLVHSPCGRCHGSQVELHSLSYQLSYRRLRVLKPRSFPCLIRPCSPPFYSVAICVGMGGRLRLQGGLLEFLLGSGAKAPVPSLQPADQSALSPPVLVINFQRVICKSILPCHVS